jgi:hypothetical protein
MKFTLLDAVEQGATMRKITDNPYREGCKAWVQFNTYRDGHTVKATLARIEKLTGSFTANERFRWDINHKTVKIDFPAKVKAEKPAKAAAPAKKAKPAKKAAAPAKVKKAKAAKVIDLEPAFPAPTPKQDGPAKAPTSPQASPKPKAGPKVAKAKPSAAAAPVAAPKKARPTAAEAMLEAAAANG